MIFISGRQLKITLVPERQATSLMYLAIDMDGPMLSAKIKHHVSFIVFLISSFIISVFRFEIHVEHCYCDGEFSFPAFCLHYVHNMDISAKSNKTKIISGYFKKTKGA